MSDLKQTFIIKCLTEYMQDVMASMQQTAKRLGVGITGEAMNSLSYVAAASGNGAVGQLTFKEYLRFVDMGVGRGHPLGGLSSMKVTLLSKKKTGNIIINDKGRRPEKVYSKPAYGKLTWLENQLLYGYSEETKALLQDQLADN